MALPDLEPEWPRPRRSRWSRPRAIPLDNLEVFAQGEDEADPIKPQLRDHPLGQKPRPESLWPSVLLLFLCLLASLWTWSPGHDWDLTATQDLVFHQGQYWRLLTTMLVHADIAHLLANSGLFLIFGLFLRNYFGNWAFPVLSGLGGIATGALALLTYQPEMRLIGASGMVYFMVALWLVLFLRYADYLSWVHRWMRAIAFTLVVLVPTQFEPQVSYRTHAIGFALGIFFGWLSSPWMKPPVVDDSSRGDEEEEEYRIDHPYSEEQLLP